MVLAVISDAVLRDAFNGPARTTSSAWSSSASAKAGQIPPASTSTFGGSELLASSWLKLCASAVDQDDASFGQNPARSTRSTRPTSSLLA